MPLLSSYANRTLTKLAGLDSSNRVGLSKEIGINTSGQLFCGPSLTDIINVGGFPERQFTGVNGTTEWARAIISYADAAGEAFGRTGGASAASFTTIAAADWIHNMDFFGADGTQHVLGARYFVEADTTVSAGNVPMSHVFATGGSGVATEILRINSALRVAINQSGITGNLKTLTDAAGNNPRVQVSGVSDPAMLSLRHWNNNASGPILILGKSRGTTVGTKTAVAASDVLGKISVEGYDATGTPVLREAANITIEADGSPSAGAVPGRIKFQTSDTGGTIRERFFMDRLGNVMMGSSAGVLSTSATDGFLYVTGCAGTPTGVPSSFTGRVPVCVDTTNNRWYFYSGGSWRNAGP